MDTDDTQFVDPLVCASPAADPDASVPLVALHHAIGRPDPVQNRGTQPVILLVDGQEINRYLLQGILKAEPYRVMEVAEPRDAFGVLEHGDIDLIVADVVMPGMSGPDFCRKLKSDRRYRFTPVLIVTAHGGVDNEVACLEAGADDFMTRPLQPVAVRTRVRAMLRNKKTMDSLEEAEAILFTLARTVEHRDSETGNHCERLAALSVALGLTLGLGEDDLIALERGSYLHDIGKICVPDAILHKEGKLTPEEWVVMRNHTVQGEAICRPMRTLAPVLPIIRHHHERWDGTGYPDGLAGQQIPLLARILQVVDIFDALTSARPYKRAYSRDEAMATIAAEVEKGWRDPALVDAFTRLVYHPGEMPPLYPPAAEDTIHEARSRDIENLGRALTSAHRPGPQRSGSE